ncbi:uncharacterized protein [Amphiura filiformis]|uniref:uncharacterized protein n=1 Tax=Amphiura filiformis TaxID=82378 RepID=UPI003B21C761
MAMPTLRKVPESFKQRIVRIIPHALLCLTYLLYLIIGTVIFQAIEGGSSQLVNFMDDVADMRERLEAAMWNKTADASHNWTELMDEYTDMLAQPEWKLGRMQNDEDGLAWSFSSTMLFCLITITTIGYGDITPVTSGGKIFVGFYASFGIPLNVIFLADIGYLLAKLIINTMQVIKTCREGRSKKKMVASRPPMRGMRPTNKKIRKDQGGIFASRALSVHGPKSVVVETSPERPMRIMQSSIRRGVDSSPKSVRRGVDSSPKSIDGPKSVHIAAIERQKTDSRDSNIYPSINDTSFTEEGTATQANGFETVNLEVPPDVTSHKSSMSNLVNSEQIPNKSPLEMKTFQNFDNGTDTNHYNKKSNTSAKTDETAVVDLLNESAMDMMEEDQTEVPLIMVLLILIIFVLIGAALMADIEGWDYGEGLYFTFITLTTIGFGDVHPDKHYKKNFFFICIIYTVLGLAVMSTCIALVQAKVLRAIDRFTAWIKTKSES